MGKKFLVQNRNPSEKGQKKLLDLVKKIFLFSSWLLTVFENMNIRMLCFYFFKAFAKQKIKEILTFYFYLKLPCFHYFLLISDNSLYECFLS